MHWRHSSNSKKFVWHLHFVSMRFVLKHISSVLEVLYLLVELRLKPDRRQHPQDPGWVSTMWSPPHPVSLPFHIFFELQGALFMQSSSPLDLTSLSCLFFKATGSAPVLCSVRAPFYDPCLISVSSCWLATQISTSRYSINILVLPLLYLTINNNHSHPPAQFLSLLKFNPQCLIHIDVLTDLNRVLTGKHDKQIPWSHFVWLHWFDLQKFQGKSYLEGGKHPKHT